MPKSAELEEMVRTVRQWQSFRDSERERNPEPNAASMRQFIIAHNGLCRKLISIVGESDPDFWTALYELGVNSATLTDKKAKLIVEGEDMKDL